MKNFNKSKTAAILLQIDAIKLNPKEPFRWASGWKSPIYCDNRIVLSYPKYRDMIVDFFCKMIKTKFNEIEVVAGVATGAIGIGVLVANQLNLPFIYVRPEEKKHGRKNKIEGNFYPKQNVVVIEDLISTGTSSLRVVDELRKNKLNLLGMAAIFNYGFEISKNNFEKKSVILHVLCDYPTLLEEAIRKELISEKDLEVLKIWNKNPEKWS